MTTRKNTGRPWDHPPRQESRQQMTPRQEAFVVEYLRHLNATQAARRAGYSASRLQVRFWNKNDALKTLFQLRGDGKVNEKNLNVKGDLAAIAVERRPSSR